MATTKLTTAEELMALPDDGWQYELIEGVLHRMSPAGFESGRIASEIAWHLSGFVRRHGLGEVVGADTGFLFERDPDVVRAPDAAFVRADRLPPRTERRGYLAVALDLAVEVVSPSDRPQQVADKVAFYLAHGVPLVWVAYPDRRQVAVHRPGVEPVMLGEGDVLDGGDVLPGFRLSVAEIFR